MNYARPRCPRYRSLDLWRGLACLMVVASHTFSQADTWHQASSHPNVAGSLIRWLERLAAGVSLFFVISGYCIAATADSARRRPRAPFTYFRRRLWRIVPPYWAAIAIAALVLVLWEGWIMLLVTPGAEVKPFPLDMSLLQWFGNLTLTESWRTTVFGGRAQYCLSQAWTLCYEEQFYLVIGLVLVLTPRRFLATAALVTLLVAVGLVAVARLNIPVHGLFCDGHWLLFAAGMLVYATVNYASRVWAWVVAGAFILGSVVVDSDPLRLAGVSPYLSFRLHEALAFAAILLVLHPLDERLSSSRLLKPLAVCGTMCYSLYLIHGVVVHCVSVSFSLVGIHSDWETLLVVAPLSVSAALAAGWLFHRSVERHFLNDSLKPRMSPTIIAVPSSGIPSHGYSPRLPEPSVVGVGQGGLYIHALGSVPNGIVLVR